MKSMLARTIAVTLALVFMLGAVPAQAHTRIEPTSLTLRANDTRVDRGDRVTFSGSLRSDWKRCKAYKSVTLFRGKRPVATRKTTRAGLYAFTVQVPKTATWKVKFKGKRWGVHPHVHRCLRSTSRGITVRVR